MMKGSTNINYEFDAKIWCSHPIGGWFFVSLPRKLSKEIRSNLQWQEEGWGRMKATAKVKEIVWSTAIWFDKKQNTYLLPIKAAIRKKADLSLDDTIKVSIML